MSRCRTSVVALVAAATLTVAAQAQSGRVTVTIHDGIVSVFATNATIAEVLDAWARAGGTTIIHANEAQSGPLTLELREIRESEALSIVLRSIGGYVAIARSPGSPAGPSQFDRIIIIPSTSNAPLSGVRQTVVSPVSQAKPATDPGDMARIIGPNGDPVADDQDGAPPFVPTRRPAGFSSGDEPPQAAQPAGPVTASAPVGATTPGVILPAPLPAPPQPAQR